MPTTHSNPESAPQSAQPATSIANQGLARKAWSAAKTAAPYAAGVAVGAVASFIVGRK